VEKYGRARQATDNDIIRRMRIEFWIAKTTDMYSEFVILFAFSWQRWLRERASILLCSALFVLFKLHIMYIPCNEHADLFQSTP
jgi:hypothetical protein